MEPDILLVDEVLAVGDAEFQKKCLGKMEEVTTKEGRTILFVSHNLAAIEKLCKKTAVLTQGKLAVFSETSKALEYYQSRLHEQLGPTEPVGFSFVNGSIKFQNFVINNIDSNKKISVNSGEPIIISCDVSNSDRQNSINIGYGIRRKKDGVLIIFTHAELAGIRLELNKNSTISTEIKVPHLVPDNYTIEFHVWVNWALVATEKDICEFSIPGTVALLGGHFFNSFPGVVFTNSIWKIR